MNPTLPKHLLNLCALADFQAVYFLWRPCLPDASDDMVLELADAAQVLPIVSFNARDFVRHRGSVLK